MAIRPKGAGAQLLLQSLLQRENISPDRMISISPPAWTESDIAQAIRAGRADCGIATRSVATAAGVDFIPLVWENLDLVMRQRDYFRRPLQAFLEFIRTPTMAARAEELDGYDLACAGQIRFAP
jgi:putative molybdopterin biosynthesis protein